MAWVVAVVAFACLIVPATATGGCVDDDENGRDRALAKYRVSFITNDGKHYLTAQDDGTATGFKLAATSKVSDGVGDAETFTIFDLGGRFGSEHPAAAGAARPGKMGDNASDRSDNSTRTTSTSWQQR